MCVPLLVLRIKVRLSAFLFVGQTGFSVPTMCFLPSYARSTCKPSTSTTGCYTFIILNVIYFIGCGYRVQRAHWPRRIGKTIHVTEACGKNTCRCERRVQVPAQTVHTAVRVMNEVFSLSLSLSARVVGWRKVLCQADIETLTASTYAYLFVIYREVALPMSILDVVLCVCVFTRSSVLLHDVNQCFLPGYAARAQKCCSDVRHESRPNAFDRKWNVCLI